MTDNTGPITAAEVVRLFHGDGDLTWTDEHIAPLVRAFEATEDLRAEVPGPGQLAPEPSFTVEFAGRWFDDGRTGWVVVHPAWVSDEWNEVHPGVVSEHREREEADWIARALNFRAEAESHAG